MNTEEKFKFSQINFSSSWTQGKVTWNVSVGL